MPAQPRSVGWPYSIAALNASQLRNSVCPPRIEDQRFGPTTAAPRRFAQQRSKPHLHAENSTTPTHHHCKVVSRPLALDQALRSRSAENAPRVRVAVQPHHPRRAALIEVDDVAARAQEVAE